MSSSGFDIIVMGGSSGSIGLIADILGALPASFRTPVVIVIHRLRNVDSDLKSVLCAGRAIAEPEDKEAIREGMIYLAPQNYHLLVEDDHTFSLDYSELINYSRPSIDVTFSAIAMVYGHRAMSIVLSGANGDGAAGTADIIAAGGAGVAQDPATAEYDTMPAAAIKANPGIAICSPAKIVDIMLGR